MPHLDILRGARALSHLSRVPFEDNDLNSLILQLIDTNTVCPRIKPSVHKINVMMRTETTLELGTSCTTTNVSIFLVPNHSTGLVMREFTC